MTGTPPPLTGRPVVNKRRGNTSGGGAAAAVRRPLPRVKCAKRYDRNVKGSKRAKTNGFFALWVLFSVTGLRVLRAGRLLETPNYLDRDGQCDIIVLSTKSLSRTNTN